MNGHSSRGELVDVVPLGLYVFYPRSNTRLISYCLRNKCPLNVLSKLCTEAVFNARIKSYIDIDRF